ncbi:hypothetical protein [Solidesulfovibrio sp.]|jgi:hypothetical protein|uniref:hypothetical protein n=1 Tax=Solidesulfovibrio sp. TaxID=2910990 RepID=UPI002B217A65|nr:hypothetical protein [Solidesulfovibrio sp.]MEA5089750.1 hypothetical protein [Solidesulfovibrio sp.]HML60371.1 hypothetical protein [Solidesulfovibrio sp.]
MQKRVIILFDIFVLTSFGAYLAMAVWHLPEPLRHRLLTASLGMLAKLTGMTG